MTSGNDSTSLLGFTAGGERFAVPLDRVLEILPCRSVVRVPNAQESLRGVMNVRGSVIPVLDIARHLGFSDTVLGETTCAVLIETDIGGDNTPIAALVEEIRGVADVPTSTIVTAPDFGTPVNSRFLIGASPSAEGLTYVIDVTTVLAELA